MKKLNSSTYSSLVLCLLATTSMAQMGPSHNFYADSPISIHHGDIDGDGDQDILAGTRDGLVWYENLNGQGNFGQFTMINGLGGAVHCADLDGDGLVDLVSSSNFDMQLLWYKNNGGGVFSSANVAATAFAASYIEVADIDGDGDPDLLCTGINNGVRWYENTNGLGAFSTANIIAMPSSPVKAQAGDMDGDGDQDVFWRSGNGQLKWAENTNGSGTFGAIVGITLDGVGAAYAADIDSDGDLDILTVNDNNELIAKRNTSGAGVFGTNEVIGASYLNARSVVSADLDKDGDQDLVAISMGNDEVSWHENLHGEGVFGTAQLITDLLADPISLNMVDIDGDGDLDILTGSDADDSIEWYENLDNAENLISGRIYQDIDQDGVFNNTDYGLSGKKVWLSNGAMAFTNLSGIYQFPVNSGTYNVTHDMGTDWTLTSGNASYTVVITQADNASQENDFGFTPVSVTDELASDMISSPALCSYVVPYFITVVNTGTTVARGEVKLDFDDLLTFIWADPAPVSTAGGQLLWQFEDLLPTQDRTFVAYLLMPDASYLGTMIQDQLFVDLRDANDNVIAQYNKPMTQELNCALDPNDKLVLPTGEAEEHFTRMGDEFEYTVRFQNTGTATATHVYIADTLDPSLDWSTLRIVSSSHSVTTTVTEYGLVMFSFENIMLPDSNANEPGSHGAIKFAIEHLDGIDDGTIISNTAHIFFDMNPAIITNTVFNTMVPPMWTGVEEFGREDNVTVFPNPFATSTTVQFEQEAGMSYKLSLLDVSGRIVRTYTDITGGSVQIHKGELTPGIYHFHLIGKNRTHSITSGKLMIQ